MNVPSALRQARSGAKLTQTELARRAGTSQSAIAAYESGAKQPSVETLGRILLATGTQLSVEPAERPVVTPSKEELRERGRILAEVMVFADSFPVRRPKREMSYPPLRELVRDAR